MAIRNELSKLLQEKNISTYRLWNDCDISENTAYRLLKPDYVPKGEVIDKVCEFLGCQVGDWLIHVPSKRPKKASKAPKRRKVA